MKKKKRFVVEGTFYPSKSKKKKQKLKGKNRRDDYINFLENKIRECDNTGKKKGKGKTTQRIEKIEEVLMKVDERFSKMKGVIRSTQCLIEEQDKKIRKKELDKADFFEYVDRKILDFDINLKARIPPKVKKSDKKEEGIENEKKFTSLLERTLPQFQNQIDRINSRVVSRRDIVDLETKIEKLRNVINQFTGDYKETKNRINIQEDKMKNDLWNSIKGQVEQDLKKYIDSLFKHLTEKIMRKQESIREEIMNFVVIKDKRKRKKTHTTRRRVEGSRKKRRENRLKELYAEVASLELEEIHSQESKTEEDSDE